MSKPLIATMLTLLATTSAACDSLPKPPSSDPPNTARNASTSQWFGQSSNGSHSLVRQVSTGPTQFSFVETWFAGGKIIATEGQAIYEPSTGTNVYSYTKPEGIVVVRTSESAEGVSTRDQVLLSTMPSLFKAGDTITYIPRNQAPREKLLQLE